MRYSSAGATPTLAGLFRTAKPLRLVFERTAPPCGLGRSGLPEGPGFNHLSHTTGPVFRLLTRFAYRRRRIVDPMLVGGARLLSQRRAGPLLPDLLGQPIQHASLSRGLQPWNVTSRPRPFRTRSAGDGAPPFPAGSNLGRLPVGSGRPVVLADQVQVPPRFRPQRCPGRTILSDLVTTFSLSSGIAPARVTPGRRSARYDLPGLAWMVRRTPAMPRDGTPLGTVACAYPSGRHAAPFPAPPAREGADKANQGASASWGRWCVAHPSRLMRKNNSSMQHRREG